MGAGCGPVRGRDGTHRMLEHVMGCAAAAGHLHISTLRQCFLRLSINQCPCVLTRTWQSATWHAQAAAPHRLPALCPIEDPFTQPPTQSSQPQSNGIRSHDGHTRSRDITQHDTILATSWQLCMATEAISYIEIARRRCSTTRA